MLRRSQPIRLIMVQIHRIFAGYMNVSLPLEPDVNEWLEQNDMTEDRLIKVTFHTDHVATGYPPPNDFKVSNYAVIYYKGKIVQNEVR